jgi:hypothetical protein
MEQQIKDVESMLDDVLESVRSHHGEDYAKFVVLMTSVAQMQEAVSSIVYAALDKEDSKAKDNFVQMNYKKFISLIASTCSNLASDYGLDNDNELEGALKWAGKIVDMASEKMETPLQ